MQQIEITKIKPGGRLFTLDFRELWKYRELLYFLTWRDIKIRYKQTAIGIAWAVLQPLVTTAIFTVIFSVFARFDTGTVPYPLFALGGLTVWLFVHTSITLASGSFVNNANLVTKVYFPRIIVPISATLAGVLDMFVSMVLVIGMMIYYGVSLTWQILWVPAFLALAVLQTAAFGTLFSALHVRFRDVKFGLPFMLQVWLIVSPVFYPSTLFSEKWKLIFALNPLTGILEGLRAALFGSPFDWPVVAISTASVIGCSLLSFIVFNKMEDDFADLI